MWCSPLPALLVIATGTIFCFLWPRRRVEPLATAPAVAAEAQE
jgi:hypothetical protein